MKKVLIALAGLSFFAFPFIADAAIATPWNATSTDPGYISPNLINGNNPSLKISSTATSTFSNGINFLNGCLAYNGTCLISGGGSSGGLSTTSPIASSNLLVYSSVGAGSAYGIATSTLTASSPLTGSFTQIGSGGALGCQTASGSQAGCLSSADWTTFNTKQSLLTGTQGQVAYFSGTNTAIGTSTIFITPASAVGINTLTPSAQFDVAGTTTDATAQAMDIWNSAIVNLFRIRNDGHIGIGSTTPGALLSIHALNQTNNLNLFTVASSTASATTTFLTILNTGFVGIGTSSPNTTFVVANDTGQLISRFISGTTNGATRLQLQGNLQGNNFGEFRMNNSATGAATWTGTSNTVVFNAGSAISSFNFGTQGATPIVFYTGSTAMSAEKFRIDTLGNIGIGTSSPFALLSISARDTTNNPTLFSISSSTSAATTTLFNILNTGFTGISTSSPGSLLSIGSLANFTTATSTFYSTGGINLTGGGCFAINGTCVGAGGSGTVTSIATNNGITGGTITTTGTIGLAAIAANSVLANITGASAVPTAIATSSLFLNASATNTGLLTSTDWTTFNNKGSGTVTGSGATNRMAYWSGASALTSSASFTFDGTTLIDTAGSVGLGTTTPFAKLSVAAIGTDTNNTLFAISSSTSVFATTTLFAVANTGGTTINASGSLVRGLKSFETIGSNNGDGYGVDAQAIGAAALNGGNAYGIMASSTQTGNGNNSYGGYFQANGDNNANKYSVYATQAYTTKAYSIYSALGTNYFAGNSGFGTTTAAYALAVSAIAQQSGLIPLFSVGSTTNATLLTVLGNGNIGVGTTSPYATLSVQSNASVGDAFVVATTTGSPIGGYDNDGHRFTSGPPGVISTCGTGTGTIVGDDQSGTITTATAATACTLTFAKAYRKTPSCTVTDNSLVGFADISSISTTAVTFGISSALTGGLLYYSCIYHN